MLGADATTNDPIVVTAAATAKSQICVDRGEKTRSHIETRMVY